MKDILIIDDDPDIRKIYSEVVIQSGNNPDLATNGEDGLDKILNKDYPLIILDVMLPIIDGLEVLSRLKQSSKKISGKILITTNLSQETIHSKAKSLGANYVLDKSEVSPKKLLEIIQNMTA